MLTYYYNMMISHSSSYIVQASTVYNRASNQIPPTRETIYESAMTSRFPIVRPVTNPQEESFPEVWTFLPH